MAFRHPMYMMPLDSDKALIDDELRRVLAGQLGKSGPRVSACMQYAVFSGGKRLRPLLGLSTARAVAGDAGVSLSAAAVVELLHSASLVIDDLPSMDNAGVRRSRRAAHLQFGEPTAILSAFALVLLGVRIAQQHPDGQSPPWIVFQRMVVDSLLVDGLIAGQEADLTAQDEVATLPMHTLKTAPLFELACAAGLVVADVTPSVRSAVLAFGCTFGQTFQALDDVADGDSVDHAGVRQGVANCRQHLEELRRLGVATRHLSPFVEWLQPRGAPPVILERRAL